MAGEQSALQLVLTADPALWAIVRLSLLVSLTAVLAARNRHRGMLCH
jgi:tungstate transport system permease protein